MSITTDRQKLQTSARANKAQAHIPVYSFRSILLEIAGLFLFFAVLLLLDGVMQGNEVDVLPLAKQSAQPGWLPNDWYLNQPEGYRLLFQVIVGHAITAMGFLAASLLGRLLCYLLLSVGIVFISRRLSLRFPFLIFAITLNQCLHWIRGAMANAESYVPGVLDNLLSRQGASVLFYGVVVLALVLLVLATQNNRVDRSLALLLLAAGCLLASDNRPYSIVSNEWYAGGLEAKALAYGLVFCAIAPMLHARYLWTALLLGIATSFHVLAGGYAMLVTSLYLLLRKTAYFNSWQRVVFPILLYAAGAICAMPAVFAQLTSSAETGSLPASFIPSSFIYVFIRLPHHLNPAVWPERWWLSLVFYLSALTISWVVINRESVVRPDALPQNASVATSVQITSAHRELYEFALIAMLPFAAGLLISTFDTTGSLLQYYPFRFSDMILPFSTCLLFAVALQRSADNRQTWRRPILFGMMAVIAICLVFETQNLPQKISDLRQFPALPAEKQELYRWVKNNTDTDDLLVTSPAEMEDFSWITERSTTAKLKLLPQTSDGITEWYERLGELSGSEQQSWQEVAFTEQADVFNRVLEALSEGYTSLNKQQINALMKKYRADYFVTSAEAKQPLPTAFENEAYVVYRFAD